MSGRAMASLLLFAGAVVSGGARAADIDPPPGVVSYCLRYDCSEPPVRSELPPDRTFALLRAINELANRTVHSAATENHFARGVFITHAEDGYGDCSTYAAVKQAMLKVFGVDGALAEVAMPDGALHMVVLVELDGEDLVLDNLTGDIRPFGDTGCRLIERQDSGDHGRWEAAGP